MAQWLENPRLNPVLPFQALGSFGHYLAQIHSAAAVVDNCIRIVFMH